MGSFPTAECQPFTSAFQRHQRNTAFLFQDGQPEKPVNKSAESDEGLPVTSLILLRELTDLGQEFV